MLSSDEYSTNRVASVNPQWREGRAIMPKYLPGQIQIERDNGAIRMSLTGS